MKKQGMAVLTFITIFIALCLMSLPAFTVPQLINYQGVLKDKTTGNPITSSGLPMKFRIFDAETGGTKLWEEAQTVAVEDGIYNVVLGSVTSLSIDIFSYDDRWMEVEVNNEVLSPRQRITSVAYSLKAEDAETLGGKTSSGICKDE